MQFKSILLALSALTAFGAAQASELIQNGNFETTTAYGQMNQTFNTPDGKLNPVVAGWTTNGYNFVVNNSNIDSTGVYGTAGGLQLWGPHNGSNNGLVASPVGGNYLAADGAYQVGAINQTVNGLQAGQQYQLTFYWAGAQQSGYTGVTTEQWNVSLGDESHATAVVTNANHGFTGWQKEVFTFTAKQGSEVLSFLAAGTPSGEPPFSLLDGVSMQAVPEPSAWAMLAGGLALVGLAMRRRQSKAA